MLARNQPPYTSLTTWHAGCPTPRGQMGKWNQTTNWQNPCPQKAYILLVAYLAITSTAPRPPTRQAFQSLAKHPYANPIPSHLDQSIGRWAVCCSGSSNFPSCHQLPPPVPESDVTLCTLPSPVTSTLLYSVLPVQSPYYQIFFFV